MENPLSGALTPLHPHRQPTYLKSRKCCSAQTPSLFLLRAQIPQRGVRALIWDLQRQHLLGKGCWQFHSPHHSRERGCSKARSMCCSPPGETFKKAPNLYFLNENKAQLMIKAVAAEKEQLHPTASAHDFGFPGNPLAEGTKGDNRGAWHARELLGVSTARELLERTFQLHLPLPKLPRNLESRFAARQLPNSIPALEMPSG